MEKWDKNERIMRPDCDAELVTPRPVLCPAAPALHPRGAPAHNWGKYTPLQQWLEPMTDRIFMPYDFRGIVHSSGSFVAPGYLFIPACFSPWPRLTSARGMHSAQALGAHSDPFWPIRIPWGALNVPRRGQRSRA